MIAIAVISAILAASAQVISQARQRDRETQLLWAGDQIRRALLEYSKTGVGANAFPKTLEELLQDKRQPVPRNVLRRLYHDPMTASTDWGLILNPQQRIIGVYSKSTKAPIRTGNFPQIYASFKGATTYGDWKFALGDTPPEAGAKDPATGKPLVAGKDKKGEADKAATSPPGVLDAAGARAILATQPGAQPSNGKGAEPAGGVGASTAASPAQTSAPAKGKASGDEEVPVADPAGESPAEEVPVEETPVETSD
jgi:type II secretory pathway pseudopilin PulG